MGKVADTINENYYKQIADKITQLLDKIRDSSLSDKRWVWELMQNAKDVPNKFGRVSVKLELWPDRLVFSHNGDYFTAKNITGLIQQVSSKDSANEGEEKQTGKFGTGFITTHLLSDIIFVSGIVLNPNTDKFHRFNLKLDRSARKSEEMIDSIKKNLKWIERLDENNTSDFPVVDNYSSRTEDDYSTAFTYPLTAETLKSAQIGLADLVNTLPITMVSLPKIKSVRVINHVTDEDQLYLCNNNELERSGNKAVVLSDVRINGVDKYFLTYQKEKNKEADLALSIEVVKTTNGYCLVQREASQPVLFRDFPLIGSEEFYFPYMLNGFNFEPTETRSGILLNRNEDKPKKNRAILEDAIKCALEFNEWLLDKNAQNTFLVASARIPKPQETYDEDVAKPWIETQVAQWRNQLLEQKLLETKEGYKTLRSIVIPDYGTKAANKEFYGFLKNFITVGELPLESQQDQWAETLSWAKGNKYSKTMFFEDLQRVGNVSSLASRLGATEAETYSWLNKLYLFLGAQNDLNLLSKYPVTPNQHGNFCLLETLKTDSSKHIPETLKTLCQPIINRDIKDELVSEMVDDKTLGTITSYNIDSLIQEVNGVILAKSKLTNYADLDTFTNSVSKIVALRSDGEAYDSAVRDLMFGFVSQFVSLDSSRSFVPNLPDSVWSEADKYILKIVPLIIKAKAAGTLVGLGSNVLVCPQVHSDNESVNWLNEYVSLANAYGISISTQEAIFPNQLGTLKTLEALHYDQDIPEEYKQLDMTATSADIRSELMDKRLNGFTAHNPVATSTLYERIAKVFDSANDSRKLAIATKAIAIIPQSQADCQSDCQTIYRLYKTFFNTLLEEQHVVNGSGFYPEKFCVFMLKNLCAIIAQQVNVQTLSKAINMTEEESVAYVNEVIAFTETCFGKKYGDIINKNENGLWINQNDAFCLLNDVCKDKDVEEEVKNLALNPIVNIDFKERLLKKGMPCEYFVPENQVCSTGDILDAIDNALQKYDKEVGNLQDPKCAKLVIALNAWVKNNKGYDSHLKHFINNKDRLVVGSISDDSTLSVISSIVASPEKMNLIGVIYKLPIEHLERIARGEYLAVTAEELAKYYSNVDKTDLPTMELYEDESLSDEEKIELNNEAKKVVLDKLAQDGFDVSHKSETNSLVDGVTKAGTEFPLVIKSYKNNSYQFRLNPNEWYQLMRSINSMLLVYTGNGEVTKVSFSQLFHNQDSMSLHFSLDSLENRTNISKFADILRYFKGCKFDFGNLMTTRYESLASYQLGNNNPNAFIDFSSDNKTLLD